MSENLRINQYSYADICNMIISRNFPTDLDDICKEAFEYIETKITSFKEDTSQLVPFSDEDVDICEKLFIFSFRQQHVILNLHIIFEASKYRGHAGAHSTLVEAFRKGTVTDEMSAYTAILYAAFIKQEENLDKICAGLSDEHKELYKKYFYAIFDYYKLIANRLNISEESESKSASNTKSASVVPKAKSDVVFLEPEEESMLKNMDIFKARDLSKGSLSNKMKDIYTKGLINLASTASDDGVAVTLYEKAAWLDNSTHKYTDKIVSGLHSRIKKAGCLENQNKIPLGALGDELRKIRDVFWSAPDESIGSGTRMKYLFFAFLCLALTGGLFLLSTSSIISDPTLMMFIPVIVTVVVSVIIGIIYLGFFVGLFIGFIVGSIAGVLFTYAFALVPVAAIIAALVFIIKAFRSDSSNRKKYHEHFERHNIKGKISDYLEVVACTKAPFYNMARSNELDDIRNYYLIAEKVIDVYKNI